jgi:hypothetical protein
MYFNRGRRLRQMLAKGRNEIVDAVPTPSRGASAVAKSNVKRQTVRLWRAERSFNAE